MDKRQKYTDANTLQAKVDEYFKDCEGIILRDKDNNIVTNKFGIVYEKNPRMPSQAGLAYWLGYKARQAIWDYKARAEKADDPDSKMSKEERAQHKALNDVISRACLKIETMNVEAAYDRDKYKGAAFVLERHYDYKNKQYLATDEGDSININMTLTDKLAFISKLKESTVKSITEPDNAKRKTDAEK